MAIATPEITSEGVKNVTGDLTPAELRHLKAMEARIERGLHTFREVGAALMDIRDNRLYRKTHETFEAYCRERWDMVRERAYQLIGAAEVARALGDDGEGPVNEAQARELVVVAHNLGPTAVKEVWKDVRATGKAVTAQVIRETVQLRLQPDVPAGPTPTEALTSRFLALGVAYVKWRDTKPGRRDKAVIAAATEKLLSIIT